MLTTLQGESGRFCARIIKGRVGAVTVFGYYKRIENPDGSSYYKLNRSVRGPLSHNETVHLFQPDVSLAVVEQTTMAEAL